MMSKEDYLNEYKTHKSMRDNVKGIIIDYNII